MAMEVGIQLFSVKNSMAKDPIATIKQVAEIGYKNLEAANHNAMEDFGVGFGVSAEEMKKVLDGCGAKLISAHISPMVDENIEKIMEYNLIVGNKNLIIPADFFQDGDDVKRKCEGYNKLGELAYKNGLNLLYHNHWHEFMTVNDGKTVFEAILAGTDPNYLNMQLDTYWAMRSGKDPVSLLEQYGDRIKLIHQKDRSKNAETTLDIFSVEPREASKHSTKMEDFFALMGKYSQPADFVEIGTGMMDIQRIIDAANKANIGYVVLEQDATQLDEIESIKISMENFKKLNGIQF